MMSGAIQRLGDQRLYKSADGPFGAIIVVPGLNNNPTVMDPLIDAMTKAKFHCLRVSLYQSHPKDTVTVNRIAWRWVEQVNRAYCRLTTEYPMLPLFNLSYSIGALATLRFLQESVSALFRGMALFAPPVALTRSAKLLHFVTPLGFTRLGYLGVPSLAPDPVRARRATPLREYAAMLTLMEDIKTLTDPERIGGIQTQVFSNRRDELVSYEGIDQWIERNGLRGWKLEHIPVKAGNFRHLTVSPAALGPTTWDTTTRKLAVSFGSAVGVRVSAGEPAVQKTVNQTGISPVSIP